MRVLIDPDKILSTGYLKPYKLYDVEYLEYFYSGILITLSKESIKIPPSDVAYVVKIVNERGNLISVNSRYLLNIKDNRNVIIDEILE